MVRFASFPSFETDRIEPRHGLLSLYLAAQDNSYVMMPGGLTRVHRESTSLLWRTEPAGCIKDTWVLTPEPEKQVTLCARRNQIS